jgi:hypothetical protein
MIAIHARASETSANCQDKKTNQTRVFNVLPVFVTLAGNFGVFATTSDDSGSVPEAAPKGKAARRLRTKNRMTNLNQLLPSINSLQNGPNVTSQEKTYAGQ